MRPDRREAAVEQGGIAAELIDDRAGESRPVGGIEQGPGANELGDHTAPVDVADQCHRKSGGAGEPHVGDVALRVD